MAVNIQLRRGTAAEWTAANPTLAVGEIGIETDTDKFKIGNGSDDWDTRPYGGLQGVVAATSPITYDSGTQTVGIDEASISIAQSQVTNLVSDLADKAPLAQSLNAQSSAYTLQASDNGGVIKASGTTTITVPDAVFSAGERIDIINTGTDVITIAAGAGVTLFSKDSLLTLDTQYKAASIIFDTASQAFVIGDLA